MIYKVVHKRIVSGMQYYGINPPLSPPMSPGFLLPPACPIGKHQIYFTLLNLTKIKGMANETIKKKIKV